ncbi:MAG: aminotransferase class V-fold PLP-dependent enzyme [Fidelibacterota bacterium]
MKMPTAGTPFTFSDIIAAKLGFFSSDRTIKDFEEQLSGYFNTNHVALVNSGTTACYILLEYLKSQRKNAQQTEIIMTNYTAPSLILPIKKAGLECVVVDTSEVDFNINIEQIQKHISEKTLAIMPIHMFGIPTNVKKIQTIVADSDIFILEDAASSLGSQINDKHAGTIADFGFYSLNRGKNISTLSGGIITWQKDQDSTGIRERVAQLPDLKTTARLKMILKFFALTLAVRPLFYTILNPLISKFKYTTLHDDFESFAYSAFQAAIGKNLWKRERSLTQTRIDNARKLTAIFSPVKETQIPKIPDNYTVAYNQFPIVIRDLRKRSQFEKKLSEEGIETTRLYEKTLAQIYPEFIKNSAEVFPNSEYLADHLLLIPPHPQIKGRHLNKIQKIAESLFS